MDKLLTSKDLMLFLFSIMLFVDNFMIESGNKKTVAERGYNLLNMNCLNHRDIIHTKVAGAVDPDADSNLDTDDEYPTQLSDQTGTSTDLPGVVGCPDHDLTEEDIGVN